MDFLLGVNKCDSFIFILQNHFMIHRRHFLQNTFLGSLGFAFKGHYSVLPDKDKKNQPIVISTWAPNVKANAEAWRVLGTGGKAIDAVEAGVQIPEADPNDQS